MEEEPLELVNAFVEVLANWTLAKPAEAYLVFCGASTQVKEVTASATLGLDQVVLGCMQDEELEARRVS